MIWNISRFKVFFYGWVGIVLACGIAVNMISVMKAFTPFEQIVLCLFIIQLVLMSLFFVFWGMEPLMPDLKTGSDAP